MDKELYSNRFNNLVEETKQLWSDKLSLFDADIEQWFPNSTAIERMMMLAFHVWQETYGSCRLLLHGEHFDAAKAFLEESIFPSPIVCFQQGIPETNYVVDFMLFMRGGKNIVVECDGHDFHERTKEQAEHDRKRDRRLTELGYTVLRFTGREIWRDPIACALSALQQFAISNERSAA